MSDKSIPSSPLPRFSNPLSRGHGAVVKQTNKSTDEMLGVRRAQQNMEKSMLNRERFEGMNLGLNIISELQESEPVCVGQSNFLFSRSKDAK